MAVREVRRQLYDDRSDGWLAVDRDGFVGWFYDDRTGARPVEALGAEDAIISNFDAARVVPCGYRFDRAGFLPEGGPEHATTGYSHDLRLAFVEEANAGNASYRERALDGLAAVMVYGPELSELHGSGRCLGCVPLRHGFYGVCVAESLDLGEPDDYWPPRYRRTPALNYASFGCYGYVHPEPARIASPYGRRCVPDRPLHLDQLPSGLAQAVGRSVLPVQFAEACWIQPAELAYCALGGQRYLSTTGQVHRSG